MGDRRRRIHWSGTVTRCFAIFEDRQLCVQQRMDGRGGGETSQWRRCLRWARKFVQPGVTLFDDTCFGEIVSGGDDFRKTPEVAAHGILAVQHQSDVVGSRMTKTRSPSFQRFPRSGSKRASPSTGRRQRSHPGFRRFQTRPGPSDIGESLGQGLHKRTTSAVAERHDALESPRKGCAGRRRLGRTSRRATSGKSKDGLHIRTPGKDHPMKTNSLSSSPSESRQLTVRPAGHCGRGPTTTRACRGRQNHAGGIGRVKLSGLLGSHVDAFQTGWSKVSAKPTWRCSRTLPTRTVGARNTSANGWRPPVTRWPIRRIPGCAPPWIRWSIGLGRSNSPMAG